MHLCMYVSILEFKQKKRDTKNCRYDKNNGNDIIPMGGDKIL